MTEDADIKPTHVECFECNQRTELEDDSDVDLALNGEFPCANCQDNGKDDPYCVRAVAVLECPNGVTAADWQPGGFINDKDCDSEWHEPRSGLHVIDVEEANA